MSILGRLKIAATGLVILIVSNAETWAANPSFRCSSNNTRTERTICISDVLSEFDVQMANIFRRKFSVTPQNKRNAMRRQQLSWLQWRDSCGGDKRCLRRRYVNRIEELSGKPIGHATTTSAPSSDPNIVERRLRDGRLETVYKDGSIGWVEVDGSGMGTIFPDGTESILAMTQAPVPNPVALPPPYLGWAESVEASLMTILSQEMSNSELAAYKANYASGEYYQRVTNHLKAVRFFVAQ